MVYYEILSNTTCYRYSHCLELYNLLPFIKKANQPQEISGLLLKSVGLLKTILLRFWTTCYLIIDNSPHL